MTTDIRSCALDGNRNTTANICFFFNQQIPKYLTTIKNLYDKQKGTQVGNFGNIILFYIGQAM